MSTISRFGQLLTGLWLFGASIALLVRANLGLDPWDVLHQGISARTGVSIGLVVVAMSAVVLALWLPLRQRPGIGTLANVVVVGLSLDGALRLLPGPTTLAMQVAFLATGIFANGVATGLYIGARLGPGPRDGLMTGLAARGVSVRAARTSVELGALLGGWLLGGSVGIGTIAYALAIGPLAQVFIRLFNASYDREGVRHEAARSCR